MHNNFPFKGKKVLVFGFGLHGGGLATTRWLLHQGAIVRITDKKTKTQLRETLSELPLSKRLSFTLGNHKEKDILWTDIVVVNPGVPREHPLLKMAVMLGKPLINDTAIFFARNKRPTVAVTGTRGKTTVTSWIAQLLSTPTQKILPTGNTPDNPLCVELDKNISSKTPVVIELSSWQLELLSAGGRGPKVSVITNLYPDHLNRYQGMVAYRKAKANIFLTQQKEDVLILNRDELSTKNFLAMKPKSKIYFSSLKPLSPNEQGLYVREGKVILRLGEKIQKERVLFPIGTFEKDWGTHNVSNMLQAVLASMLTSPRAHITKAKIQKLTAPIFRQQIIHKSKNLMVINDTTATSPDGTIAALRRFSKRGSVILIAGGTDKALVFTELAKEIQKTISSKNLVLLEGSGTTKLIFALSRRGYRPPHACSSLAESVDQAFARAFTLKKSGKKIIILFSPGCASFEKFLHEFDRGRQFNGLVKPYL